MARVFVYWLIASVVWCRFPLAEMRLAQNWVAEPDPLGRALYSMVTRNAHAQRYYALSLFAGRGSQVKPGPATHSAIQRAFCSKVAHLLPQTSTDKRGYSEGVRHDTSTPMYDGPAFKCTSYEHSVTAVDFNSTNGDCRTQAAAVINQHPAFLRLRTPAPTT